MLLNNQLCEPGLQLPLGLPGLAGKEDDWIRRGLVNGKSSGEGRGELSAALLGWGWARLLSHCCRSLSDRQTQGWLAAAPNPDVSYFSRRAFWPAL